MVGREAGGGVRVWLGAIGLLGILGGGSWAQGGEPSGERVVLAADALPAPTIHREDDPGLLWFEVVLVQNDSMLEALLCGPTGRTHESLFLSTISPAELQAALEGLGMQPASRWADSDAELFAVQGDKLLLWAEGPDGRRVAVEDLVLHEVERRPLRRRGWTFHGKRFDGELPEEIEFCVTFQGLRGVALSMLDSPFAYRPYAGAPLSARREALPSLRKEGKRVRPRYRIFLEPATETRIVEVALQQEGAPALDDPAPLLAVAGRVDRLKDEMRQEVWSEVARSIARGAELIDVEGAEAALAEAQARNRLALERRRALSTRIESALLELDLLFLARDRAAVAAWSEPDPELLAHHDRVAEHMTLVREIARHEGLAAEAAGRSIEHRLGGGEGAELAARREDLTREVLLARVRVLEVEPDLRRARSGRDESRRMLARDDLPDFRRRFHEEEVVRATRWVEVHEARVRIHEAEAGIAERHRAALDLDEADDAGRARLEEEIAGFEAVRLRAGAIVAIAEKEAEVRKLRRDVRYRRDFLEDEEGAAEIEARIAGLETELAALRATREE